MVSQAPCALSSHLLPVLTVGFEDADFHFQRSDLFFTSCCIRDVEPQSYCLEWKCLPIHLLIHIIVIVLIWRLCLKWLLCDVSDLASEEEVLQIVP